jgi:hypothetical protein
LVRNVLVLAAFGLACVPAPGQAQTNPAEQPTVSQQPDPNAATTDAMTPNTPTVTQRHKHHTKKATEPPATIPPTPETKPEAKKTPAPPDVNPSPPPDSIKTMPGTNVPNKEPARPMPGEEPTPQSQQNPPPPPHG